jgi:hypothetical protein
MSFAIDVNIVLDASDKREGEISWRNCPPNKTARRFRLRAACFHSSTIAYAIENPWRVIGNVRIRSFVAA